MQLTNTQPRLAVAPKKETLESFIDQFKKFQQVVIKLLFVDRSELQVRQFAKGSEIMWFAFDPRTRKCVYADSEVELRIWIEQNYQG